MLSITSRSQTALDDRYTEPALKWLVELLPGPPAEAEADWRGLSTPLERAVRCSSLFHAMEAETELAGVDGAPEAASAGAAGSGPRRGSRGAPLLARVRTNRRLTAQDHWQDVRHIDFGVDEPVLYDPGDLLLVLPEQSPSAVAEVLEVGPAFGCMMTGGLEKGGLSCKVSRLSSAPIPNERSSRSRARRADGRGVGEGVGARVAGAAAGVHAALLPAGRPGGRGAGRGCRLAAADLFRGAAAVRLCRARARAARLLLLGRRL